MWSSEWPIESGEYWFFGWAFASQKRNKKEPKLYLVRIRRGKNCLNAVTDGHFIYPEEGAEGMWQRVILPELPHI